MSDSEDEHNLDHPKWSRRARSPLPPKYANMPPEELERILGIELPRAPSLTERAKSYLGFPTNPQYKQTGLLAARHAVHSRNSRTSNLEKQYEDSVRKKAADEALAAREAAREAAIRYEEQRKRNAAEAEAERERAKLTQKLITQEDIADARKNYENLRVDANRSAITNSFVPEGSDYVTLSRERDTALRILNELIQTFEKQKRNKGGKSKRVKSKRNKRSTKRRNAHK